MSRSFNRRPSPALAVALLALFVALGGGALAATSFIGSDGQVHACVGKKGQLTVLKPGKKCGKGKSAIAWNRQGPRGIRGIQGVQGPGAISFDRQFDVENVQHPVTVGNGFIVKAYCYSGAVELQLVRIDGSHAFYAWGTKAEDGVLSHPSAENDTHGSIGRILAQGSSTSELDVVAESTAAGEAVKWTRFDLTLIQGTKCNLHGMVTSSSSVG